MLRRSFLIVAIVLMLTACRGKEQSASHDALFEASRKELASAVEERDELIALMAEIARGMEQIKRIEHLMTIGGVQSSENPARRRQILADMASLKESVQKRRERLAELEQRLEKSSLYTDELKGCIALLRSQIDDQAKEIDGLRRQLDDAARKIVSLTGEVDSLNATVADNERRLDASKDTAMQLEKELNTCYYAVASRRELKRHHILETGFLRRSRLMEGDFDKDFFVVADKRRMKVLPIPSAKVKVLTNHPDRSYEIRRDGDSVELVVTDPAAFWSLGNFLVVQSD